MNISHLFKPEKCLSHPKRHRKNLEHAILDGSNLIATDGRVAVILPVERSKDDRDGYVSPEALINARKVNGEVKCGDSFVLANGMSLPRNPEIEAIKPYDWKMLTPTEKPSYRVGLNVESLTRICEAMGDESVVLEIIMPESGIPIIKVSPVKVTGARGIMMGVKID